VPHNAALRRRREGRLSAKASGFYGRLGYSSDMNFKVEVDREDDGRWIAEVAELPGVLVYGDSAKQAQARAQALALRVLADRLENSEALPFESVSFAAA